MDEIFFIEVILLFVIVGIVLMIVIYLFCSFGMIIGKLFIKLVWVLLCVLERVKIMFL